MTKKNAIRAMLIAASLGISTPMVGSAATKKDYGYAIKDFYHIGETRTDVIRVADFEWNKASYYILDRSNYTVKKTTKKYYEEVKKQNKK